MLLRRLGLRASHIGLPTSRRHLSARPRSGRLGSPDALYPDCRRHGPRDVAVRLGACRVEPQCLGWATRRGGKRRGKRGKDEEKGRKADKEVVSLVLALVKAQGKQRRSRNLLSLPLSFLPSPFPSSYSPFSLPVFRVLYLYVALIRPTQHSEPKR